MYLHPTKILCKIIVLFCMVVILVSCSNTPPTTTPEVVTKAQPRKVMVYEIQNGKDFVGTAHKYEWEPKFGKIYYYYLVYDARGNLVANIRQDGFTQLYSSSGDRVLGNYPITMAMAQALDAPSSIKIEPPLDEQLAEIKLAQAEQPVSVWEPSASSSHSSSPKPSAPDRPEGAVGPVFGPETTEEQPTAEQPTEQPTEVEPTEEENWPGVEESWDTKKTGSTSGKPASSKPAPRAAASPKPPAEPKEPSSDEEETWPEADEPWK